MMHRTREIVLLLLILAQPATALASGGGGPPAPPSSARGARTLNHVPPPSPGTRAEEYVAHLVREARRTRLPSVGEFPGLSLETLRVSSEQHVALPGMSIQQVDAVAQLRRNYATAARVASAGPTGPRTATRSGRPKGSHVSRSTARSQKGLLAAIRAKMGPRDIEINFAAANLSGRTEMRTFLDAFLGGQQGIARAGDDLLSRLDRVITYLLPRDPASGRRTHEPSPLWAELLPQAILKQQAQRARRPRDELDRLVQRVERALEGKAGYGVRREDIGLEGRPDPGEIARHEALAQAAHSLAAARRDALNARSSDASAASLRGPLSPDAKAELRRAVEGKADEAPRPVYGSELSPDERAQRAHHRAATAAREYGARWASWLIDFAEGPSTLRMSGWEEASDHEHAVDRFAYELFKRADELEWRLRQPDDPGEAAPPNPLANVRSRRLLARAVDRACSVLDQTTAANLSWEHRAREALGTLVYALEILGSAPAGGTKNRQGASAEDVEPQRLSAALLKMKVRVQESAYRLAAAHLERSVAAAEEIVEKAKIDGATGARWTLRELLALIGVDFGNRGPEGQRLRDLQDRGARALERLAPLLAAEAEARIPGDPLREMREAASPLALWGSHRRSETPIQLLPARDGDEVAAQRAAVVRLLRTPNIEALALAADLERAIHMYTAARRGAAKQPDHGSRGLEGATRRLRSALEIPIPPNASPAAAQRVEELQHQARAALEPPEPQGS